MQPAARTAPRGWTKRSKVDTDDSKEQRAGFPCPLRFLGVFTFNHGRKGALTGCRFTRCVQNALSTGIADGE